MSEFTLATQTGPAAAPPTAPNATAHQRHSLVPSAAVRGALWLVLTVVFSIAILAVAYETARHFSGVAIDGPFQLYNALRRIDAGFTPGLDFQYFHGLGVPYLHYWLYRLFGGGLAGSELAREMVATAIYPIVFLVVFRSFTNDWTRTVSLTAAALALSLALHLSAIMFALNGMLGVRAALPTLLPAGFYACRTRRARTILCGFMLGCALFVSTEQGLAALIAYVIVSALAVARCHDRRGQLGESAATIGLGALCLVLFLTAVGGTSGMRGALRYNFRIVPMDQYWFFGAPPNLFVPSWRSGVRMLVAFRPIGIAIALCLAAAALHVARFWRAPDGDVGRRHLSMTLLSVYGLASCGSLLGIFTLAYSNPCWRVVLILGLLELSGLGTRSDAARAREGWLGVPRIVAGTTLACSAWAVATIPLVRTALTVSLPHIIVDHLAGREPFSVAGIWPETLREGQDLLNTHRRADGTPPVLWSTYAGWLEARNGVFHPSVDYIIHALGPEGRARYLAQFLKIKPDLVQTVRPTYTQYEQWLENEDWAFYDEVLGSYKAIATTPWSIFWERRSTPAPAARFIGMMRVPPGLMSVQLPPLPTDTSAGIAANLLEVEIEYETRNSLRALPIIGHTPRFLIGIDGALSNTPISLDPFVQRVRFPIVVRPGQQPTLHFQTVSLLPGAAWTPRTLQLWVRPLDGSTRLWFSDLVNRLTASAGS